jgi:2-polyprenyl-3-methyl-5-hydroxy-6-metoxy-1,4-benzoquinol methylase
MSTGSGNELAMWERRYRAEGRRATEPSRFVVDAVTSLDVVPGAAVDVAGGIGRHAVWLAGLGWRVTLVDGSPSALAMAVEDAAAAGVELTTIQMNLTGGALPSGPWDLVLVHHYLNHALMASVDQVMAPGGHLLWAQPTVLSKQLRPGPGYRLALGEAETMLPAGLEVVSLVEGETEGRHEAMVVARRPGPPAGG